MKKWLLMGAIGIVMPATALLAQTTPLPYQHGFDVATGWQTYRKGNAGANNWAINSGRQFAGASNLYHGYPVGGTSITDDWYVSPAFSFASGGRIDSLRTRFSGFGVPGAGDTVAIYLLRGTRDPATATEKILLHNFQGTNYVNDNAWYKLSTVVIPNLSGNTYIAFRYHTISNWLDVNFDNLGVSGNATNVPATYKAGVHFSIGPNPTTGQVNIITKEAFQQLSIYDITGRTVLQQTFQPVIDIAALPAGSYVLELVDKQEQKGTTLLIKQ